MATTIKLKNSVSASVAPASLELGECAVNITDKKVWVGNASSTPVLISDYNAVLDLLDTPVTITGNASGGSEIRLPEDTDNGSNYVGLKAADSIASNVTFTLPSADGTNGQVLRTDGSGTLSFTNPGAGSFTYLSAVSANNTSATIEFSSGFTTDYDCYMVVGTDIKAATDNDVLNFYFGDGSGWYDSSTYGYAGYWAAEGNDFTTVRGQNSSGVPLCFGTASYGLGNATGEVLNFVGYILNPRSSSAQKQVTFQCAYTTTAGVVAVQNVSGALNKATSTSAMTKFKFYMASTGNIVSGTIRLYGIKNS